MLTAEQRTKVYEDRSKVIAEMTDTFYIFSRSIFFNPEMAEQYNHSHDKYINYFMQIVRNIDIFLQEDQLMCTKAGFLLVPVPGYLPSSNDLEQTNASQIIQTVNDEVTSINKEMQVIMQGDNKHTHINKSGDKYQNPHVLVAKLFTIFTRTCSGSYTISWLECRQTNMFDAKTVILY